MPHFTGGKSLQRQDGIVWRHATAIVRDLDALTPTIDQENINASGPRIQGIVEEFFDHGGRAFDHFPSGNAT
jgi:hypothetical protein